MLAAARCVTAQAQLVGLFDPQLRGVGDGALAPQPGACRVRHWLGQARQQHRAC